MLARSAGPPAYRLQQLELVVCLALAGLSGLLRRPLSNATQVRCAIARARICLRAFDTWNPRQFREAEAEAEAVPNFCSAHPLVPTLSFSSSLSLSSPSFPSSSNSPSSLLPPSLASSSTYLHQLPDLLVEVDLGHFRLSLPYDKDRLSPPTTLSPRVRLLGADLRSPISDLHAVRCVDLRRSTRGNSVEIAEKRQGREGAKGREEEKGEGGRGREREKAAVK